VTEALELRALGVDRRIKVALVWAAIVAVFAWAFLTLGFNVEFMVRWLPYLLAGVPMTIAISIAGIALAVPLALLGALGRLSRNSVAYGVSTFYTSFIRGTPLIVQIFLIYLGLPQLAQNAPGWARQLLILSAITSGVLALGINYGAYMTEIFRAGIESIPHGQREAADAMGMTPTQAMRRVILPQAIRVIIPPTGNEYIAMLKDSALVSFMGVAELFWRATRIGRQNFLSLEMLLVAAAIYWILSTVFTIFQSRLERRLARGHVRGDGHGR
jgi:polar amino acid transport system permease protein